MESWSAALPRGRGRGQITSLNQKLNSHVSQGMDILDTSHKEAHWNKLNKCHGQVKQWLASEGCGHSHLTEPVLECGLS